MKNKTYSLYTFSKSKLIWTETESLQQALRNFNRRLNIDHNGYNHPDMEYALDPMRVITTDVAGDNSKSNETILSFNCNGLDQKLLKEFD
tara:strand:+ start:263 stop:532 length:270 start_codon:yes stop_codon:yes gene_type:complete